MRRRNVTKPAYAQRAHAERVPGYYVVNPRTGIAVAGPYHDHGPAQEQAALINSIPPPSPDPLEVRLLEASR